MVEVIITEFQGIITEVEVYEHPLDADLRRTSLILQNYPTFKAYREALDDSNAETVIHHHTKVKVK